MSIHGPIPDETDRYGITRAEAIEQVRVNLLRYLELHRNVTPSDVAARTGYTKRMIWRFLRKDCPSLVLSQKILMCYPEVGDGLAFICPHCGRLPHFRGSKN